MKKKDPNAINKREKAIIKFIEKQTKENGYPPSVREIGKAVGLKSTATWIFSKISTKRIYTKGKSERKDIKVIKRWC